MQNDYESIAYKLIGGAMVINAQTDYRHNWIFIHAEQQHSIFGRLVVDVQIITRAESVDSINAKLTIHDKTGDQVSIMFLDAEQIEAVADQWLAQDENAPYIVRQYMAGAFLDAPTDHDAAWAADAMMIAREAYDLSWETLLDLARSGEIWLHDENSNAGSMREHSMEKLTIISAAYAQPDESDEY